MTQIAQGAHVYLFPEPGQVYRVQADDVATVQVLYGAPSAVITLTAQSQTFGPYDSPAKIKVTANTAPAEYTLIRAHYAELTPEQIAGGAVGVLGSNNAGGVVEPDGDVPTLGGGSSVTVINDLTTGGATAALSAEMGKSLQTGKMANSLPAMSAAFSAGTAAEKSEYQSLVSGGLRIIIKPSGDTTFAADSAAVNAARDALMLVGGGVICFAPGTWYVKDHELGSGVAYICESLPRMATDEVCADLGLDDIAPFLGGAVFKGTGTETVFSANATARVATSALPDPADRPVTGVRIERLAGWNIATLVRCGATDHNGLAFSTLRDLYGFAIKGTFLDLRNIQHVNGGNFKAIDARHTLYICNDHSACQTGNSHLSDIYGYSWAEPSGPYAGKGTDWQIKLECIDTGRNFGGNLLNYITLNGRIQCNNFRDTVLDRTRGNAQIVLQGASLSKSVNVCEINGTDMEGRTTYGLYANYTTGCRVKTNGASSYADTVATIKVKNSLNFCIDSNTYDTTVWLDAASSSCATGYVRYYAYDANEATLPLSQMAKGFYTLLAQYSSGTTNPVYTNIGGGNGQTMMQLGTSNSYAMGMSESDNVLRLKLIPIAQQLTPISSNKTWGRWEASTVLLSGAATTQTLPTIDSKMDGVPFTFRATDGNTHTIQGQAGQLIDGSATYSLPANGCVSLVAVSSGTKWVVTGKF